MLQKYDEVEWRLAPLNLIIFLVGVAEFMYDSSCLKQTAILAAPNSQLPPLLSSFSYSNSATPF